MQNKRYDKNWLTYLSLTILIGILAACASIQQPTGGPRDKEPPKVLKETPLNQTLNFKAKQTKIDFDEYIKLKSESKEFSISPSPDKNPYYTVKGKSLIIKFADSLIKNTTYVINFGRGLVDYNEGNILKNYTYVFSTGDKIDSLSITGNVTDALTKKPILDATVFIIPTKQDSIFGKKRASIFTTTDSAGNFSLRYLRPDIYRIYALKEESGDRIYNSSNELIAFQKDSIDLQTNISGISLKLFKEEAKNFRVLDKKIEKDAKLLYIFNKKLVDPEIKIMDPQIAEQDRTIEFSKTADTLNLWTRSMDFDSIKVELSDKKLPIDTILIRRGSKDKYNRELKIGDNIPNGKIKPGTDLVLSLSAPVGKIDPRKISLLQDSLPARGLKIAKDSLANRKYIFKYPWKMEKTYTLKLDTAAFEGLYGGINQPKELKFSLDDVLNYGNLLLTVNTSDTTKQYIVQILNERDEVIREDVITKSKQIIYKTFNLGKYHFRVAYDLNKNGKWDTGDVENRIQPEPLWGANTTITLRANWDLEEKFTIPENPEQIDQTTKST